jgi:PST family polysaccharide transporter
MTDLRAKVLHGLSWNFVARFGTQFAQLASGIVLARLLTPSEFGVIGMLFVFTGFAQILSDSGLNAALIYHQEVTEAHRSTAFWVQCAIGASLTVIFVLGAPLLARFYHLSTLAPLTRLIAVVFLAQALGQVQYSLLTKEFQFRKLAATSIGATVLSGSLAVLLAWLGYGVWALAWQMLAAAVLTCCGYWLFSSWRPRLLFDRRAARELGNYAVYLLGYGSLNYWMRNGDNLAIARLLGAYDLGIYARAYTLMLLPLNNISAVIGQVMFPALSQMRGDLVRFGNAYLRATRLIALISFPLMTGLAIFSDAIVALLFGPKWLAVVPILRVFSFVGLLQSIVFPVGWVFTALGKTRDQFRLSLVLACAFVIAIAGGIRYGLQGVAYAYSLWTLLTAVLNLQIVARYMKLSLRTILGSVARIALMTIAMGTIVFWFDTSVSHTWLDVPRLAAGVLVGAAVYVTLCVASRDGTFGDLLVFLREKRT